MDKLSIKNNASRIQFISSSDITDIVNTLTDIIAKLHPGLSQFKVIYAKYFLNIPTDFQIIKYTLYLSINNEQTPLADVFNSTTFEMIPYWEYDHIKIGNPWVLLRWRFIDIWVLKLIMNIDKNSSDFLKNKLTELLDSIKKIRRIAVDALEKTPEKLFQLTNYSGVYINETVAKKNLIKDTGETFKPYYPSTNDKGDGDNKEGDKKEGDKKEGDKKEGDKGETTKATKKEI